MRTDRNERGFSLIEVAVGSGILTLGIAAAAQSQVAFTHAVAHLRSAERASSIARDILSDARAAAAYDPAALAPLAGTARDFSLDGAAVHVSYAIAAPGTYTIGVSVTDPGGAALSVTGALIGEAPAPGASLAPAAP
jgi:type II secretory pathway pseudopilin PulG